MSVAIRPADTRDAPAIRALHLAAFPTAAEADLVERLEEDGDKVLSLVAEDGAQIIGHIVMSRMRVEGGGRTFRALGLAPVAVLPERQGEGIGRTLVGEALACAATDGEELVFVVGEPDYYGRFGFSTATAAPFASRYAGPYLMAQAFGDVTLPPSARADYPPTFAGLDP